MIKIIGDSEEIKEFFSEIKRFSWFTSASLQNFCDDACRKANPQNKGILIEKKENPETSKFSLKAMFYK